MAFWMRSRSAGVKLALAAALIAGRAALADDPTVATITVTSATAGSSVGELVEGKLRFRDREYLLTLRGVAPPVDTRGTVMGMSAPRQLEGTYEPSGEVLRNKNGVTIRFDPPIKLRENRLEIEVTAGIQPKNPRGQPGAGVE
jgi:hypothetical protein